MRRPLEGLRVVDCSRGIAGGRATGILADYGADVVWVEPPGGDPCRAELPAACSVFHRGKRSIVLDLRDDRGRAHLGQLVATADIFVESWRPGVADHLGVGYDRLHRNHPTLVYCSISGFGRGPFRDVPGHEALVHALLGTMAEQPGHRDGPIFEALPFAGIGAAHLALIGTLAALYRRHDDGVGRHVETSLLDGALAYLSMLWGESDVSTGGLFQPGAHRIVARSFLCQDGEYVGVHTGAVGAFGRLMVVLGLDDRIPPSETGLDMGVPLTPEEHHILETEVFDIFASRPRAEWVELLREADVCAIEHLHPCDVFDQPQALHNEMVVTVDDPVLGRVQQVAPPAKLSRTPGGTRGAAPVPGQHTDEILAELDRRAAPRWGEDLPSSGRRPDDERPLLDGVRILDFGAFYAGPYSSRLLADLGADVVKIETMAGDPIRGMERPFFSAQAGKRAIAADLKHPGVAPVVARLVAWADVVHHNLRPGAAERLGLGYEQVQAHDPALVYLYSPGFGSSGPDTMRQSFAPMLSGYVGIGFESAGEFNPPLFPMGNEDPGNGLLGAAAILMALLHRQRTGEGQYVEAPQLNATMAHMAHAVRTADGTVIGAGLLDAMQYGNGPLERLYPTADGWVCVVAFADEEIAALGGCVGIDILNDARFTSREARAAFGGELSALLEQTFVSRTTAEWLRELRAAGVPAAEPVPPNMRTFLRDLEHQQVGRVAECSHPTRGTVRELATLVRVSDSRPVPHRLAPEHGEHTDEVLAAIGCAPDDIAELRRQRAVR